MVEMINNWAAIWWHWQVSMFWQVSLLIVLVGCVDVLIRKWIWPQVRYALWLMVLVKLILPPGMYVSSSIMAQLEPFELDLSTSKQTGPLSDTFSSPIVDAPSGYRLSIVAPMDAPAEIPVVNAFTVKAPDYHGPTNRAKPSKWFEAFTHLSWQSYALLVWLLGMGALGIWLSVKLCRLRREPAEATLKDALPSSFHDTMARCARHVGLHYTPGVIVTRGIMCPAVTGVIRPVLLMPVGFIRQLSRQDIEHMLMHEFAHIKRGDMVIHGLYMVLQIVYWYNPLLWLVSRQMHHLREICCDATVAGILKEKTMAYRQTLLDIAKRYLTQTTHPGLGLLGLFENTNYLGARLNWLKRPSWRHQRLRWLTIVILVVSMTLCVLPMAQAKGPVDQDIAESSDPVNSDLTNDMKTLQIELERLKAEKRKLEAEKAQLQKKQAKEKDSLPKTKQKPEGRSHIDWQFQDGKWVPTTKPSSVKSVSSASVSTPVPMPKPMPRSSSISTGIKVSKNEHQTSCEEKMTFTSPLKASGKLTVDNGYGSIIVTGDDQDQCRIMVLVKAKAESLEAARARAKSVNMKLSTSDNSVTIKPVKANDKDWKDIRVDISIQVPRKTELQANSDMGPVTIKHVHSPIKVATNMGAVHVQDIAGDIDLGSNMGSLTLITDKDCSATVKAVANMGSIHTDLPITVNKEMMGANLSGTLGTGKHTIHLHSNMGAIKVGTPAFLKKKERTDKSMVPTAISRSVSTTRRRSTGSTARTTGTSTGYAGSVQAARRRGTTRTSRATGNDDMNVAPTGTSRVTRIGDMDVVSTGTSRVTRNDDMVVVSTGTSGVDETTVGSLALSVDRGTRVIESINEKQQGDTCLIKRLESQVLDLKPGAVLDIVNQNGTIVIEGSKGNTCRIAGKVRVSAPTSEKARSFGKQVGFEVDKTKQGLAIRTFGPKRTLTQHTSSTSFHITVPHDCHLIIRHEDGDIELKHIHGSANVKLEDGTILCEDMSAQVDLSLEDGKITVQRSNLKTGKIRLEDGVINCSDIRGNIHARLEDGLVNLNYADRLPETCDIDVRVGDGHIRLSAPTALFSDNSSPVKTGDGAQFKAITTTDKGNRVVSLKVNDGSIKVDKR